MRSFETKGVIYAVLSGILYGLLGYFGISIMNEDFSVSNMSFWRFFISSLVIAIIAVPSMITKFNYKMRDILLMLSVGAAFYYAGSAVYFIASQSIGTGLAMVIFFV